MKFYDVTYGKPARPFSPAKPDGPGGPIGPGNPEDIRKESVTSETILQINTWCA